MYQIDNYSDTTSEFLYTLERNIVILWLFETLLTLWIQLVIFMKNVTVVIGGFYGNEGKGKVIDYL